MFEELKKFREDRAIDKMAYVHEAQVRMDIEETFELIGYTKEQTKALVSDFMDRYYIERIQPVDDEKVDAHCDKIVFAVNALALLGYDPAVAIDETIKEISSRVGAINKVTGKWEKFDEQPNKYKANYALARIAK